MTAVALERPDAFGTRRPDLRLVPAGPGVVGARGPAAVGVPAAAGLPLRLTRRGRLARTLAATAILAAAVLVLAARLLAPAAPVVDHATTVSPGQTLSDVAAEQLPGVPVDRGVAALRVVNDLNSTEIQAGQTLLVPEL